MNRPILWKALAITLAPLMMIAFAACEESKTVSPPAKEAPSAAQGNEARDPNRLWCNEHNVYEDECLICHPELAKKAAPAADPAAGPATAPAAAPVIAPEARDPKRLWCNEHNVYEDECLICHPELKEKKVSQSSEPSGAGAVLMCNEHRLPESDCGICRPEMLANLEVGQGVKVRFASGASTTKAGVVTGPSSSSSAGTASEVLGEVSFNRNQLAMVTPLAGGVVLEVYKDVGATVETGDVLAMVQSVDVAQAKSAYLKTLAEAALARKRLAREQDLHQREISARQDLEVAQAAVAVNDSDIKAARQALLNLGLSKEEVAETEQEGTTTSMLPVRAPFAGTIVERHAVQGTSVEPGVALFQVADLSTMWLELSVPENQLASLRTGAKIQARFEAYPGLSFEGQLEWVSPSIDPETRMFQVRAVLPNAQGLLKNGLFGRASLGASSADAGITVPSGAIQDVDGQSVVFKKLADDLFETRLVELGASNGEGVVVLAGLAPQDEIVTKGSYIVKSELLKARMGAGCTDD